MFIAQIWKIGMVKQYLKQFYWSLNRSQKSCCRDFFDQLCQVIQMDLRMSVVQMGAYLFVLIMKKFKILCLGFSSAKNVMSAFMTMYFSISDMVSSFSAKLTETLPSSSTAKQRRKLFGHSVHLPAV